MDRSETVKLISETYITDDIGQQISQETETTVFCSVNSVSRDEFFTGGKIGLKPQHQVTINRYEYNNQKICELYGKRFAIYRTYIGKGESLELYLEEQSGVNES